MSAGSTALTASPPSAEAPAASYVPRAARRRRRNRRVTIVTAAAVVVALLVSFSLWPSLLYGPSNNSSSNYVANGVPVDYYRAAAIADSLPTSGNGSSWMLIAAEGIRLSTNTLGLNVTTEFGISNCTLGPGRLTADNPPNGTEPFRLPATPASAPAGEADAWVFVAIPYVTILYGNSGYFIAFLVVNGTAGYVEGIATGTCTHSWYARNAISNPAALGYIPVNSSLDSTNVTASFDSAGGTSFLTNHTGVVQRFYLLGTPRFSQPVATWETSYTTCTFGSVQGTGATISAQYNATTGVTLSEPSSATAVAC